MGRLITRVKVMPADVDVNLDALVDRVRGVVPDGVQIKRYSKEPIAFGISALMLDMVMDEDTASTDSLEERLRGVDGVGEVEVVSMSRESARL
ncbi:MAG: elongation factor 1-beta [Candidatus Nitrosocaldus sp.]|nr:elongation factor 1-beta [Candidatus Nitrosocaldus sp.]MCS7141444.1 elongation factor 1-beta [Candidatus Nitrosocaldus sp.]MDW7999650.1 elongation factor 1-beta [Candidatus Nitrosocaldus sp.]MDW8275304.1 elongation factor 1-beta [Candidatus Nitrosocaldus sp.]